MTFQIPSKPTWPPSDWTLSRVWSGLNVVDATFTCWAVMHGGQEVNPAMLWLLDKGMLTFIIVKVGVGTLASVCLAELGLRRPLIVLVVAWTILLAAHGVMWWPYV